MISRISCFAKSVFRGISRFAKYAKEIVTVTLLHLLPLPLLATCYAENAKAIIFNTLSQCEFRHSERRQPVLNFCRRSIAVTKWLVEDYVDAYALLAKKHIRKICTTPVDVCSMKVVGATSWGSSLSPNSSRQPHAITGIYDPVDRQYAPDTGLPSYHRRGISMAGAQYLLFYCTKKKQWQIKPENHPNSDYDRPPDATGPCDHPCLPHLTEGTWKVIDRDTPGGGIKYIDQSTVRIDRIQDCTPPSADVHLFWEMIETTFQYVALMRGPIHNQVELVELLSRRRDLCVEEAMASILSYEALTLYGRLVMDRIP